ncbi:hypothetical protein FA13DRAFT_94593 [Coprinellus micaceus]|uniref:Uncharacterized protein n=1 Tax=Coprinellus micaceus TaxID=71717 RepID=A0A4Y7SKD4_COPMI|nr:hypothetical protein FA13DRAFT_94593 [Coprinellus micaceus]
MHILTHFDGLEPASPGSGVLTHITLSPSFCTPRSKRPLRRCISDNLISRRRSETVGHTTVFQDRDETARWNRVPPPFNIFTVPQVSFAVPSALLRSLQVRVSARTRYARSERLALQVDSLGWGQEGRGKEGWGGRMGGCAHPHVWARRREPARVGASRRLSMRR